MLFVFFYEVIKNRDLKRTFECLISTGAVAHYSIGLVLGLMPSIESLVRISHTLKAAKIKYWSKIGEKS